MMQKKEESAEETKSLKQMETLKQRPTRKDVAKLAGVSTATVSYILNNKGRISPDTKKRVLQVIDELGYTPNHIAKTMKSQRSQQLGLVINTIFNPIYASLIQGFEESAISNNFFVNICTGEIGVHEYLNQFISRQLEGIFIEAMPYKYHREEIDRLLENNIRVLVWGYTSKEDRKISSIENDYEFAMFDAAAYLQKLGHNKICYMNGIGTQSHLVDRRHIGFRKAVKHFSLEPFAWEENTLTMTETSIESGYEMGKKLLKGKYLPTAVICTNDLMAIGLINLLKDRNISVPEEISVMGFDNNIFSQYTSPRLTTMSVDYHFLGQKAFEFINLDINKNIKSYYKYTLNLVIRESTGPARS